MILLVMRMTKLDQQLKLAKCYLDFRKNLQYFVKLFFLKQTPKNVTFHLEKTMNSLWNKGIYV